MKPTRRDTPFREAMRSLLVFDGAMGSLLYERGVFVTQNFEQLNVTRPEVVRKIHEDYVAAGAQVIETNTFGAQPLLPRPPRPRRPGARVQRRRAPGSRARRPARASGSPARSARPGCVPGVGEPGRARPGRAPTFAEQAAALVGGRRRPARARDLPPPRGAPDRHRGGAPRPRPGCRSSRRWPSTERDAWPTARRRSRSPRTLRDWGADVIGVNCGDGPQLVLAIAERMRERRRAALRAAQRRPAAHASTIASSTWPRRSTSTSSRAA